MCVRVYLQQNTENMLEHCAYWDYNAPPKYVLADSFA